MAQLECPIPWASPRRATSIQTYIHTNVIIIFYFAGQASETLVPFMQKYGVGCLVTDFSPLRISRKWVDDVKNEIGSKMSEEIMFVQLDAHNVVPCWEASDKLEYGARTIRWELSIFTSVSTTRGLRVVRVIVVLFFRLEKERILTLL